MKKNLISILVFSFSILTTTISVAALTDNKENTTSSDFYYSNEIPVNKALNEELANKGIVISGLETKFWLNEKVCYSTKKESYAMRQESRTISKTLDGGKSWELIGYTATTSNLFEFSFINEDIGFFCHRQYENELVLYRTEDGAKSFQKIVIPEINDNNDFSYFLRLEAPWQEGDVLYMYAAETPEHSRPEYYESVNKALLKSTDMGISWIYTGINVNQSEYGINIG